MIINDISDISDISDPPSDQKTVVRRSTSINSTFGNATFDAAIFETVNKHMNYVNSIKWDTKNRSFIKMLRQYGSFIKMERAKNNTARAK